MNIKRSDNIKKFYFNWFNVYILLQVVFILLSNQSTRLASGQLEAVGAVLSVVPVTSILATAGLVGVKLAALSRLLQVLGYDRAYLATGGSGTAAQPIGLQTNYAYMFPYVPGLNISVKGEHSTHYENTAANHGHGHTQQQQQQQQRPSDPATRKAYPAMGLPGDYESQNRPFRGSEMLREIFKEAGINMRIPTQQGLPSQGNGQQQLVAAQPIDRQAPASVSNGPSPAHDQQGPVRNDIAPVLQTPPVTTTQTAHHTNLNPHPISSASAALMTNPNANPKLESQPNFGQPHDSMSVLSTPAQQPPQQNPQPQPSSSRFQAQGPQGHQTHPQNQIQSQPQSQPQMNSNSNFNQPLDQPQVNMPHPHYNRFARPLGSGHHLQHAHTLHPSSHFEASHLIPQHERFHALIHSQLENSYMQRPRPGQPQSVSSGPVQPANMIEIFNSLPEHVTPSSQVEDTTNLRASPMATNANIVPNHPLHSEQSPPYHDEMDAQNQFSPLVRRKRESQTINHYNLGYKYPDTKQTSIGLNDMLLRNRQEMNRQKEYQGPKETFGMPAINIHPLRRRRRRSVTQSMYSF